MKRSSFSTVVTPMFVLVFFLAVSFYFFYEFKEREESQAFEQFSQEVRESQIGMRERLEEHINILYAGRGLFAASGDVSRKEWDEFVKAQSVDRRLEGLKSLEYIAKVDRNEKSGYESAVRRDKSLNGVGYPDFEVYPVGDREQYYVTEYVYPMAGNEDLLGFDVYSNPERRATLEDSRDSGLPAVTRPLKLLQQREGFGLLVFLPVYESGVNLDLVESRRVHIEGFVLAVFDTKELLNDVLFKSIKSDDILVSVIDNTAGSNKALLEEEVDLERRGMEIKESLNFYGRKWDLVFKKPFRSRNEINLSLAWAVLILGSFMGVTISALIYSFASRKDKALALADKMTYDLRKYKMAVDSAYSEIVITDPSGKVVYANESTERLTGFSKQEMVGRNLGLWWEGKDKFKEIWKKVRGGKKPFQADLENVAKNKRKYDTNTNISPVIDKDGDVKFYVSISEDITEKKNIERMKDEFIRLASHQLRTPLSAIKWLCEMLIVGDSGKLNGEQLDFVQTIDQSNERMITIVSSLLNISSIEAGRIPVNCEDVKVYDLIHDVAECFKKEVKEKKISIKLDVGKKVKIYSDAKLLREVCWNLIGNAVKYSYENGSVVVELKEDGNHIVMAVKDSGCGISVEEQNQIFNKFFRAENAHEHRSDGNGLGLYLSKVIVEFLGGKIWFESENEGKSTDFYVKLPKKLKLKKVNK